jgi:beta-glucosidase
MSITSLALGNVRHKKRSTNLNVMLAKALGQALGLVACLAFPTWVWAQTGNISNTATDAQVEALLRQMTVEEKIGQMTQITMGVFVDNTKKEMVLKPEGLRKAILEYKVGSILNNAQDHAQTVQEWHTIIKTIQDIATKEGRLKVPVLYGVDAIHGATYISNSVLFPQQLGIGCARNRTFAQQMGRITAASTRASGVRWNFAPVLDVARSPLWSRFPETFGESTYLVRELGVANIVAAQGGNVANPTSVAACMKHFLGYSATNSGKDRTTASLSERDMRETFLPPFRAAVRAGAKTVMINSGDLNGIPVHANKRILTDLLRTELGFEGLAVTDWEDIVKLNTRHKVAPTLKEAVLMAIEAGVDMSMVPYDYNFCILMAELVKEGKITEARLDLSVRRILKLKYELGLMTNAYPEPVAMPNLYPKEAEAIALNAARESLVLLKNDNNTLPIPNGKKVLVVGPTADHLPSLNGSWSYTWQGTDVSQYPTTTKSILAAMKLKFGAQNVSYVQGADLKNTEKNSSVELLNAAQTADYVVVCLGEDGYAEIPGNINDLNLPMVQTNLVRTLAETKKPIVLVLAEGRPRLFSAVELMVKSVVFAPQPGTMGGVAIAELLAGDLNPSGRLSFSYPKHTNDLLTHDARIADVMPESNNLSAPGQVAQYQPLYPFGAGMSYSTFAYGEVKLSKTSLKAADDSVLITIKVTNKSTRAAKHALDLMVSDVYASVIPAYRLHKGFIKQDLMPGETKDYVFTLKAEDLSVVNIENKTVVEPGEFRVFVADKEVRLDVIR